MDAIWTNEEAPPLDHEAVKRLARQIRPDSNLISVKRASRLRPLGNCYWNVARVVEESGGDTVLGWLVSWWPKIYVVGMHHAVWRMPNGRLIDVTEPPPKDRQAGYSVFLPDDSTPVDLQISPCIDNLFIDLCGLPEVKAFIEAYKRRESIRREISIILRERGYRCEHQFAIATVGKCGTSQPPLLQVAEEDPLANLNAHFEKARIELDETIKAIAKAAVG